MTGESLREDGTSGTEMMSCANRPEEMRRQRVGMRAFFIVILLLPSRWRISFPGRESLG
jgi:hypothetical protein